MSELLTAEGWPIVALNDDGIRPAGRQDECFYCRQKVGHPHSQTCVIVQKRVRVRYTFEVDINVPYAWGKEQIEFHRNDSSWCADNAIQELENQAEQGCLCPRFSAEFVRVLDATPTRHLRSGDE